MTTDLTNSNRNAYLILDRDQELKDSIRLKGVLTAHGKEIKLKLVIDQNHIKSIELQSSAGTDHGTSGETVQLVREEFVENSMRNNLATNLPPNVRVHRGGCLINQPNYSTSNVELQWTYKYGNRL